MLSLISPWRDALWGGKKKKLRTCAVIAAGFPLYVSAGKLERAGQVFICEKEGGRIHK